MTNTQLIEMAFKAQEMSYSPYSNFKVGAALLGKSGKVYTGCNIESASFTPSICAERTAFSKAVSEGEQEFEAIAIVGGQPSQRKRGKYCSPCGVCRQVMMEFCAADTFKIILANSTDDYVEYTLGQLLPLGFGPTDLD